MKGKLYDNVNLQNSVVSIDIHYGKYLIRLLTCPANGLSRILVYVEGTSININEALGLDELWSRNVVLEDIVYVRNKIDNYQADLAAQQAKVQEELVNSIMDELFVPGYMESMLKNLMFPVNEKDEDWSNLDQNECDTLDLIGVLEITRREQRMYMIDVIQNADNGYTYGYEVVAGYVKNYDAEDDTFSFILEEVVWSNVSAGIRPSYSHAKERRMVHARDLYWSVEAAQEEIKFKKKEG